MKRSLSILLIFALSILLAGCGTQKSNLPENPPSHGTITGPTYKSDYTGLRFTVNSEDKWVFSSEQDLAAGCGIDAESYSADFAQVLENNKTVYDMMALSESYQMSIVTGFENLTLAEQDPETSAEDYVNSTVDTFTQGLNEEVATFEVSDTEEVTLCDYTYARKILTVTSDGGTFSQAYYTRNLGGYMSITLVFFPSTISIEQVEAMFA